VFDVRNDHVGALHHPSSYDNDFGIVGVNEPYGIGSPDVEASVADRSGNGISSGGLFEEFFESYFRIFSQTHFRPGPVLYDQWQ
jgi:hypothetical protein